MTPAGVPVLKLNGTRNAFALVDARVTLLDDPAAFARRVCGAEPGGLGTDGLLVVLPSARADARMRIINADGSEAEMCGNGMRCVARYLDEHDGRSSAVVETLAGRSAPESSIAGPNIAWRWNSTRPSSARPTRSPGFARSPSTSATRTSSSSSTTSARSICPCSGR